MNDNPTLLIAGDSACERVATTRFPKARILGSFRDLSLVEYVLGGARVDLVMVDSTLSGRGETLEGWLTRCKAAFPGISVMVVDVSAGIQSPSERRVDVTSQNNVIAPQTIVVWSPKGGVGKTFLATNLACAAAIATSGMAGLVDLDLYSGDVAVHLDLIDGPTITEMLPVLPDMRPENLDRLSQRHAPSGLSVLCSPKRPELSDLVTVEHVKTILTLCAKKWPLVYVDTPPDITSDIVGECIDAASKVILVVTQDVATLKQSKLAVDIFGRLGIPRESLLVVLNRSSKDSLMPASKVQEFLGVEIAGMVPDDRKTAERSVFEGKPAVLYTKTEVSEAIWQLAERVTPGLGSPRAKVRSKRREFSWRAS